MPHPQTTLRRTAPKSRPTSPPELRGARRPWIGGRYRRTLDQQGRAATCEYDGTKRVTREVQHRECDGRSEVEAETRFEYLCNGAIDDAPFWPR